MKAKEEENVALQSEMVTAREKHEEATAALMAATTPAHQVVTKHITVLTRMRAPSELQTGNLIKDWPY